MMRTFCGMTGLDSWIVVRPGHKPKMAAQKRPLQLPAYHIRNAWNSWKPELPTPANSASLRIHAVNHAGEGDDLADVLGAANPGDGALEAEAETGVGDAAVAAEIEVPLEGLNW